MDDPSIQELLTALCREGFTVSFSWDASTQSILITFVHGERQLQHNVLPAACNELLTNELLAMRYTWQAMEDSA